MSFLTSLKHLTIYAEISTADLWTTSSVSPCILRIWTKKPFDRRNGGHDYFGQCCCNADYRRPDYELRYFFDLCDPDRAVNKPVSALYDEHDADDKQKIHQKRFREYAFLAF